jgi:hypothetical protein
MGASTARALPALCGTPRRQWRPSARLRADARLHCRHSRGYTKMPGACSETRSALRYNRSCGLPESGISSLRTPPSHGLAGCMMDKTSARVNGFFTFPRNKNAALPVRAQTDPLAPQRPEKNGSRMAPSVTSFRAPSECHNFRRTG